MIASVESLTPHRGLTVLGFCRMDRHGECAGTIAHAAPSHGKVVCLCHCHFGASMLEPLRLPWKALHLIEDAPSVQRHDWRRRS